MQATKEKISKEQRCIQKGSVDRVFVIKMTGKKEYLGKDKKLYTTFMDLKKACDRAVRESLWNILKVYDVAEQFLEAIKAYEQEGKVHVCKWMNSCHNSGIGMGVGQGLVMLPWSLVFLWIDIRKIKPSGKLN